MIGAREFNLGRAFRLNPAELVLKDVDLVAAGLSQQVRRLISQKFKERNEQPNRFRISPLEQIESDAIQDSGNGKSFAGAGLALIIYFFFICVANCGVLIPLKNTIVT